MEVELECDASRVRPDDSEVERLLCDSGRMRALTSWSPRYTLDEGLCETIEWFRRRGQFKSSRYHV